MGLEQRAREGRDEIRDHEDHAGHSQACGSSGSFREEKGRDLTCVSKRTICHNGDAVAWRGTGPAWGHSAAPQISSQARDGSRARLPGRAKCRQGGVATIAPGAWPESALGVGGRYG